MKELKEGSISFMVYGYPPARNKLAQEDNKQEASAENAFQRRRTMLSKEPVIDAHEEAKVLGLNKHDANIDAPASSQKTADKDSRMQR